MNQNVKNFVSRMLSMVVSLLGTMLIARIVVQTVGGDLYGFFQLSNDFITYASILTIALNGMAARYITIAYVRKEYKQANEYYNSVLFGDFLLTLIIWIPGGAVLVNLPAVINIPAGFERDVWLLFLLMFLHFGLTICTSVFSTAMYVKNRVDLDSYRNIEREVIRVAVVVILYGLFSPKIWYVGIAILLGSAFAALRNYIYTRKLAPEIRLFDLKFFNWRKVWKMLRFGSWISLMKISYILMEGLDLILANRYIGSAAMGIISLSKTLPRYLLSGMGNVTAVFSPSVMIEYAKGNKERLVETCVKAIHISAVVFVTANVMLITAGGRLFRLWMPSQDADLLHVLLIITIFGYLLVLPMDILWTLFTAANRVRISSIYMTVDSILTILIVLFLLNRIPDETAKIYIVVGVSSVTNTIRGLFFLPYFSARVIGVKGTVFYGVLARILACTFLSCIIGFGIQGLLRAETWLTFFLLCVLLAGETFIVLAFVLFTRRERELLANKVNTVIRKRGIQK